MDKELLKLQKEVIGRLIDYETELDALGKANQLKKTRRVSSSVAFSISEFPDLIDNLLSQGVSTEKLVKDLRNFEEKLIRDTAVIKGTETPHHIGQLRTGGGFYKGPIEVWSPTIEKLEDFFQTKFGNSIENIRSYINLAHKQDTNTKGLEAESIGSKRNPIKEATAHKLSPNAKSIVGNLSPQQLTDPVSLFNELAARLDFQINALKAADAVQQPTIEAVQKFDPKAYTGNVEQNKITTQLAQLPQNKETVKTAIRETLDTLIEVKNGAARYTNPRLANNLLKLGVGGSLAVGLQGVASKAQAGDFEGAAGEGISALVGEVPFIGDVLVMESEGRAAGERLPENITPDQFTQYQIQRAKSQKSIPQYISNEVEWAVNNPGKAVKNVAEAGLTTALAAGKQAFDSPMLAPYTTPIKAINGAMKFFGF